MAGGAIIVALLALAPRTAAAQLNPFDRPDAPAHVHNFNGGTLRDSLEREFQADLYVMGSFAGARRIDRFEQAVIERPQPWKFYGRVGIFNFQREIEPQYNQGLRFSFRRTGPRLTGRVYIGVHRTFD